MDNTTQLYLRQFSFFSLFGKCGKYASKIISLILVFATIFCCAIPTYAADGTENIDVADMTLKGEIWYKDQEDPDDVTSSMTIGSSGDYYRINLPIADTNKTRLLVGITLTELFDFNTEHEYSLKFQWKSNIDKGMHCYISLVYYDNQGTELKVQDLVNEYDSSSSGGYNSVDISFKPDTSGLSGGYNCDLRIYFMQNGWDGTSTTQAVFISKEIELIDKDDDSGWFQKILDKINDVWESVKELPNKIGVALGELGDNILDGLKSLFIPEDGFFDAKKQEMETFLEDHFGVIFTAPNILITIIEKLLTVEVSEPIISFPKIQFDLLGTEYSLIDKEIHLNLSDFVGDGSPYHILYKFYRAFATGFLIVAFANYCKSKYDYLFGKDGEAV